MKPSLLLLLGSLLANGALVAALVLTPPSVPPTAAAPGQAGPASAPASSAAKPAASAALTAVPTAWARLHTDNLDELQRRLRAAGFPPQEVRAMLAMAITEQVTERREAIQGNDAEVPYWKNRSQMRADPARQAQLMEAYREANELNYKYLTGPDALVDNEDALIAAKRRFGDLPLAKLQQLTALQHDLDDLRMQQDIQRSGARPDEKSLRAAGEAMQALAREHLAEVAKLLTPAELEQYELRNNTGGLRMGLATFRPSEEEFKAIYAAGKSAGMAGAPPDPTTAQTILGPDRYAEYLAATSSDGHGKLGQLIARLDLPMTTITTVNAVRDDISARSKAVLSDSALSAADRNAALAALAQEAQQRLTSSLGDRGYRAYADIKGDWLRPLKPKGP